MFSFKRIATAALLWLIVCLSAPDSYGQAFKFGLPSFNKVDEAKGFIVKDNIYTQGFLYFNKNQPAQVAFSTGRHGTLTTYTADELTEFGIDADRIKYLANTVVLEGESRRVFVEEILRGSLFYLHSEKTFYRNSDPMEPLSKETVAAHITSLSAPATRWNSDFHLLRPKPQPVRYFARNLDTGKSPTTMFTHIGLFVSFNTSTLTPAKFTTYKAIQKLDQATSANMSAGVYADFPFWAFNNWSFLTQAAYGKMRFAETVESQNTRYDMRLNLDYARLALMPKYTLSFSKLRLFANAGPTFTYHLKHDSQGRQAVLEGQKVYVSEQPGFSVKQAMLGLEGGAGISYFFLPKHYLSLQFSQSKSYSRYFNVSNQSVRVSVNL
ncbi:outer membrane beta-barrel protein [Pontibacter beigongshangensis]|uniref:outer membrane beta-barrel protein n=1 Tax=Pontibacter beigongshangensis TaxID=2574733 RepID=UPI00164FCC12|nr:outer membrane beta-barrel protein [Pontibacter beigongshangensis]